MRKGSALLIVLGMMAFMVISAVAFSAYMRTSRLPSSFLRRASTSRLLAKAALAEAIDEIDGAIGNNPHPGVGTEMPRQGVGSTASALNGLNADARHRNHWRGRVYVGSNELYSAESTVSTLTLEGLAYVPPPLVNEARYYSRRSQAGCWKKLGFDAGRYAFCAIDVSDYFDVNALMANVARSSAAGTRISLAYLFESTDHATQSGTGGTPAQWDDFMKNFTDEGKVPLVSMADWNLAVHELSPCGMLSEFCQFVTGGRTSFYGGIGDTGAAADKVRRQAFVTDSWFPPETAAKPADAPYDLNDGQYQPFTSSFLMNSKPNIAQVFDPSGKGVDRMFKSICSLGFAALYDYLDPNRVPCSLAIPTTERVPMVCGVWPQLTAATLKVVPDGNPVDKLPASDTGTAGQKRTNSRTIKYKIDGFNQLKNSVVTALFAYPFAHADGVNDSFDIDGRLSFFFTSADMGLRTGKNNDALHLGGDAELSKNDILDGVIRVPLTFGSLKSTSFGDSGNLKTEAAAVKSLTAQLSKMNASSLPYLTVTYDWEQTYTENPPQSGKYEWSPAAPVAGQATLSDATCDLPPLTEKGVLDENYTQSGKFLALLENGTAKLKLNAAVWVRVKHNDKYLGSKTVDLVPACMRDDLDLNKMSFNDAIAGEIDRSYPLLRFDAGVSLDLTQVSSKTMGAPALDATPVKFNHTAIMVADPRYNHAPESWFAVNSLTEGDWLKNSRRQDLERDGDIFMQVSDQGYLQSIYELANLPRLTEFYVSGNDYGLQGSYCRPDVSTSGFTGSDSGRSFATRFEDTANSRLMWKTYDPFPGRYRTDGDDFIKAGFTSAGTGFKVNPFSDSTNILMSVFANTPHDWRCASTNEQAMNEAGIPENALSFNKDYAWNSYSSGSRLDWEDLEALAGTFIEDMRDCPSAAAWEVRWRNLGWYRNMKDASQYLLNDLDIPDAGAVGEDGNGGNFYNLWNTDRKFLYGYWHDCFAAKQQLFLVFVRAEPMMAGGAAGGKIPPQLGARAVALVWRDPAATADNQTPHRTRVLFYRQFD